MWNTLFKIKKIFTKIYRNISNVYESIYYDLGVTKNPIVMVGANGIGGGNYGSFVDVSGSVTNNSILSINSTSKDEAIFNIFNYYDNTGTNDGVDYNTTQQIIGCCTLFLDFSYAYTYAGPNNVSGNNGAYVDIYHNNIKVYSSYGVTTWNGLSSFPEGDCYKKHQSSSSSAPPRTTSYCVFTKSLEFPPMSNVVVNYYFHKDGGGYKPECTHEVHISALKKNTNDITRDIYATVIEQVDPTTIN